MLGVAGGLHVPAVHVDHGLRAESVAEASAAMALAERIGVPCEVVTVDIAPGANLEARARTARRRPPSRTA